MKKITYIVILSLILGFILVSCNENSDSSTEPNTPPETGVAGDDLLKANLAYFISENDIPAVTAMTVKDGEILDFEVEG